MANYISTSLLVTVQMLDANGSSVYAGANSGLFVWGAQLELGTEFQTMRDDADNYKYARTRGTTSNSMYMRIGRDYFPDAVLGDNSDRYQNNVRLLAHKGGVARDLYINTNNSVKVNAAQIAEEVFVNYKADSPISKRWYQLAPYYQSYAHVVDYPTDTTDHVRVGSKQLGKRTSGNNYENIAFYHIPPVRVEQVTVPDTRGNFYNKGFFETKTIPRIPKYDAAQVMGIFNHYKTTRNIDQTKYLTLSGDYTYYRAYNWFSITPNTKWSKFAYGSGDQLGPVMHEVFEFTDTLSLIQTYKLPPDYFFPLEYITFQRNLVAKRGRYDDRYTKTGNYTSSNATQIHQVFYNKPGSPFGKKWFQLTPYYNSYTHTYDFPNDYDYVKTAESTRVNVLQDLFTIDTGSSEDYQTASGAEDYQVIPT